MGVLQDERGSECDSMSQQNPDDLTCSPCAFHRYNSDGSVEKTFWVRGDWHLVGTKKLGELVVIDNIAEPTLKIVVEPQ